MRMLINVLLPTEPFNSLVREGVAGDVINELMAEIKPEAVYFTEQQGCRSAVVIVDVKEASQIPAVAEPFFLKFDAHCEFHIVMSPEDLAKSGLDELGRRWR